MAICAALGTTSLHLSFGKAEPAVDGGDGLATVDIDAESLELVNRAAMRLAVGSEERSGHRRHAGNGQRHPRSVGQWTGCCRLEPAGCEDGSKVAKIIR